MSRATSTYILMILAFGLGLWAILSFGAVLLHAPTDLSGRWALEAGSGGPAAPKEMVVDQSGRFFSITLGDKTHAMQLVKDERSSGETADHVHVELAGDGVTLTFDGPAGSDDVQLRASGAIDGQWRAKLADPTYARRRPSAAATKKAAALQIKAMQPTTQSASVQDEDISGIVE